MEKETLLRRIESVLSGFASSEYEKNKIDKIINAIKVIDRRFFVGFSPYEDTALPIGHSQTISQPSTVARMLMLLDPQPKNNVLEIGSGSGWNAALLGFLVYAGKVLSLDIIPVIIEQAKRNLKALKNNLPQPQNTKCQNISFQCKNIFKEIDSWEERYDRIIITAGIENEDESHIQRLAKNLLHDDGRLICPYQRGPMIIIDKQGNNVSKQLTPEEYAFVPLRTEL